MCLLAQSRYAVAFIRITKREGNTMNSTPNGAAALRRKSSINRVGQLICLAGASLLCAGAAMAQTNLALNKTTYASSELRAAKDAVDGSSYSRWESTQGLETGWLTVDLGAATNLSQVAIDWEAANPEIYQIQGSNNNSTWTTLATKTGGTFGNRTDSFNVSGSYRYVRMHATKRAPGNAWGYSIFEMRVMMVMMNLRCENFHRFYILRTRAKILQAQKSARIFLRIRNPESEISNEGLPCTFFPFRKQLQCA